MLSWPSRQGEQQALLLAEACNSTLTLAALLPASLSCPFQVWLAMLAVEVLSRSPGAVVQSTLERAVRHDSGRHCPLLWRCYLRFEAGRGRQDAVRRCVVGVLEQAWGGWVSWQQSTAAVGTAALGWHRAAPSAPKTCRLFLRAIGACPWAKALWCDGLALLNGRAPPKELAGAARRACGEGGNAAVAPSSLHLRAVTALVSVC